MKLKPKARADRPNPTAYTLAIGSAEAREAGLIGNKGELYEVEKTVKAGVLVVTRKGRLLGINISAPVEADIDTKIGRASCRERV